MPTTFSTDSVIYALFDPIAYNLFGFTLKLSYARVDHSNNYKYTYTYMKPIPGLEGLYSVTDDGRVYSHIGKGKYLRQWISSGYLKVGIHPQRGSGVRKSMRVHRLVALTFLPNPLNLTQVNHRDGNKSNNNVLNLEWSNHSLNQKHAWATGLNKLTPARLAWLKRGWRTKNA